MPSCFGRVRLPESEPGAGSAACDQRSSRAAQPAAPPKEYTLVGEIVSVDKEAKKATIKHEKIEGYMGAMTMSYPIPEQEDLDKIKAGDRITATVYDSEGDPPYWVRQNSSGRTCSKMNKATTTRIFNFAAWPGCHAVAGAGRSPA